ncbi:MAG: adenylosuccinate lyase [Nanoarchaeota archaeon]|nr:adenylosuccinate lyase [Nanoarchaeota archaeon]MBU1321483.1 adenylosuccinate lyase [Nanoarchaeota archaeon]MBU1597315.1 adenylosuccinate lyase [Nanoarchaeota archaeon]MBU2441448.1 adenylosuccinate lyase [Nanoarchaeota archaeon]
MGEYEDIVLSKYSFDEIKSIFSEKNIIRTWRLCWVALAEAEHELGLKQVTKPMIAEMKKNIDNINLTVRKKKEKETRHDVLAEIYTYGLVCPKAKGIIHLGATSQFVKDNTDLILQYNALKIIQTDLISLLKNFYTLIQRTKKIPTLGYTHFQPAQPTTLGKRFSVYAQDFLMDLQELNTLLNNYTIRGAKGATGTQASYLKLFGDSKKVKKLDLLVAKKLGFARTFPVSTQTYTRKYDTKIASVLASICSTAKKFATDIRLMSNLGIIEEPFGKKQAGSSAMPYKRNPMKSERICSLCRKVINNMADFYEVYSEQWLERSLDDSACRRIDIPQNFMLADYILRNLAEIVDGLVIFEKQSEKIMQQELPFLATEDILMECVKKGSDRQKIHDIIKKHAYEVTKNIKLKGKQNDLIQRLAQDARIPLKMKELEKILSSKTLIGLSVEQVDDFCNENLKPVIQNLKPIIKMR